MPKALGEAMQFLDLNREYSQVEWKPAIDDVFASKKFINGPQVKAFEEAAAKFLGCKYAVGVSSGTHALEVALLASGTSGTVLTTPYSFIATTEVPVRLGHKVDFCDIGPDFNIRIDQVKERIAKGDVDVFIPVHLFGQCCCIDNELVGLCEESNCLIIEDAAQAFGASFRNVLAGCLGDMGCFSFFPAKNLGCAGDGGLVTTGDQSLYEKLIQIRNHGSKQKYYNEIHGGNFRLDTLQAALLLAKLPHIESFISNRRYCADFYSSNLLNVECPIENDGCKHTYNQYVIRTKKRDELQGFLKQKDIPTMQYYPRVLPEQPCYEDMQLDGCWNVARQYTHENLALPIAYLTAEEREYVVKTINQFSPS